MCVLWFRLKDIPEVGEPMVLDGFDDSAVIENAFSSNFTTFKPPIEDQEEDGNSESSSEPETIQRKFPCY